MTARAPLVVVVAGVNFDGNRLGAQHIAERLAAYARVLYVDPPISPVAAARKPWLRSSLTSRRLRAVAPGLWRLTPLVPPGKSRAWARPAVEAAALRQLRHAVAALEGPVEAVIQIPPHFRWFGVVGERRRVHLASDDFVAAASLNAVSAGWVAAREAELAAEVDSVVAVSEPLVERWRALGHEPFFMPNGCDVDVFADDGAERAADVALPEPIAAFIGTLSDRTDAGLLGHVAERGHSVLLVGPRSATAPNRCLDRVLARPNVQWVGPRHYRQVPGYLAHARVGLVPYVSSEFNRASFPLKALDYLAAGLAVVSTDLPSIRWIDDRLIDIAPSRCAFADLVGRRLHEPARDGVVQARRDAARAHSWDRRVHELAEHLGLA
jgi:teichuronic acid biosynthesis glycosyltransferase TuaH